MHIRWLRTLAAAALILSACDPPATSREQQPAPAGDFDGDWRLTSGRGPSGKVPVPHKVTLAVAGAEVSGVAACNQYSGRADIDAPSLRIGDLMRTGVGCPGKPMVAEERYLEALEAATTIQRDGDRLRITGRDVELVFGAVPPPEPAPFEDTTWHLQSLAYGRAPDSTVSSTQAPADLRFGSDGTLTGSTGCRPLDARWERDGDVVTVTGLPEGEVDCAVAGEQNDHVIKVLQASFTAELNERSLWLQQVDGDLGLDLRADEPAG